jgi:hypothetical protein
MKALLATAGKVQLGGKNVTPEDVARATWTPEDPDFYRQRAAVVAANGYAAAVTTPGVALRKPA